jgi:hypothetical protein
MPNPVTYTISDATTATNVNTVFDSGEQIITIDFGGEQYKNLGLSTIDLSGFGTEDKLVIAHHDGVLSNKAVNYSTPRSYYIVEFSSHAGTNTSFRVTDRVSWQKGASIAKLISNRSFGSNGDTTSLGSTTATFQHTVGQILLTGIPAGLADSHFVFV